jgi:hypothetical protein
MHSWGAQLRGSDRWDSRSGLVARFKAFPLVSFRFRLLRMAFINGNEHGTKWTSQLFKPVFSRAWSCAEMEVQIVTLVSNLGG